MFLLVLLSMSRRVLGLQLPVRRDRLLSNCLIMFPTQPALPNSRSINKRYLSLLKFKVSVSSGTVKSPITQVRVATILLLLLLFGGR